MKRLFEKISIIVIGVIVLCGATYALNLSRVKTWSAAEVLTAADLNAEFDNILNHTLTGADVDLTTGTPIGSATPSTGAFTTLSASSTLNVIGATTLGTATSAAGNLSLYDAGTLTIYEDGDNFNVTLACNSGEAVATLTGGLDVSGVITSTSPVFTTPALGTPSALVGTSITGTGASFTAGAVTNATLTTALTVNTGTLTLTANAANNSVLTIGAGASSISGANTGDNTVATTGDSATSFFSTGTLATGIGGTGATAAANAANGVVILDGSGYAPNNSVDTTALNTATGEISRSTSTTGWAWTGAAMGGGSYGFYPELKLHINACGGGTGTVNAGFLTGSEANPATQTWAYGDTPADSAYLNWGVIGGRSTGANGMVYARQTYVTASGIDLWVFLLVDKTTRLIVSAWQAYDHPSYGNGGDSEKLPQPYLGYDETKYEIVLLDKETCNTLKLESSNTSKSILTLVNEEYKPNMTKTEVYKPLHSGKFLGAAPVMIETIPDYIKVRKLEKLTNKDKQDREIKHQQIETERLQLEQLKKAKVNQLKGKLGLSDEEYNLLKGE